MSRLTRQIVPLARWTEEAGKFWTGSVNLGRLTPYAMESALKVAVVQSGGCGPSVPENLAALAVLVQQASHKGRDLVLLPELCTTPYFASGPFDPEAQNWAEPVDGPTTKFFSDIARKTSTALAFGMAERGVDGIVYNSLVLLNSRGDLVEGVGPHGERYQTFRKLTAPSVFSGDLRVDEAAYCKPGPSPMTFDLDGVRLGALICYDRAFSEVWLANRHLGAQVVIAAVFVIAANRAGVENHRGHVTDYFGRSCIIAPSGEVLAEAKAHQQPEIISAELNLSELDKARLLWPVWDDRRPDLYRFMYDSPAAE